MTNGQSIRHATNYWGQTHTAGGIERLKVNEGREEVTQPTLVQGAILYGIRGPRTTPRGFNVCGGTAAE